MRLIYKKTMLFTILIVDFVEFGTSIDLSNIIDEILKPYGK